MKVNLLESEQSAHPTKTSGFHRVRALLRCLVDPEEQYKYWPPLFGTESYWRWQWIRIRAVPKMLHVARLQPRRREPRFAFDFIKGGRAR
jgi:hypothetical protein